jgi:hypothetical protein
VKQHIIKKEEFQPLPYVIKHELAGSYGEDSNKTLNVKIDIFSKEIFYEVLDHKKVMFGGVDFDKAIEAYNKLP